MYYIIISSLIQCFAEQSYLFSSLFSLIFYPETTILEKREERKEKSEKNKKTTTFCRKLSFLFGGEGEIRTLAPVTRPTPLAGAPLRPLEYFSIKYATKVAQTAVS